MKLVPFSKQYLRLGENLPFGLRDSDGRLLLGAGVAIASQEQLKHFSAQDLFADEVESAQWNRRLAAAVDMRLRQNATLKEVAAARPEHAGNDARPEMQRTLAEEWTEAVRFLDAVLKEVRPGTEWAARLELVHQRARQLMSRRPDASLYLLVYEAGESAEKYCAHHAMLVMVVCEQVAPLLNWPAEELNALGRAALTMNVSMQRLQDQLAATHVPVTPAMREQINNHPVASAAALEAAGMSDALVLDVVRQHHERGDPQVPLAQLSTASRIARLLRRVDIFTAKLSCRATRPAMSPVLAAREACLDAKGVPDDIGSAMLRAVGLYPPGSFVELANGELGLVVARGERANVPQVASLVHPAGHALGEPALRDTRDRRYSVKGAVPRQRVKVRPVHARLLALR